MHTPGPWHVNGVDTIVSVKGNRTIAKVYHPEDDGNLIAAAPDLLAALELAARVLESSITIIETHVKAVSSAPARSALDQTRVAITKAKGKNN